MVNRLTYLHSPKRDYFCVELVPHYERVTKKESQIITMLISKVIKLFVFNSSLKFGKMVGMALIQILQFVGHTIEASNYEIITYTIYNKHHLPYCYSCIIGCFKTVKIFYHTVHRPKYHNIMTTYLKR